MLKLFKKIPRRGLIIFNVVLGLIAGLHLIISPDTVSHFIIRGIGLLWLIEAILSFQLYRFEFHGKSIKKAKKLLREGYKIKHKSWDGDEFVIAKVDENRNIVDLLDENMMSLNTDRFWELQSHTHGWSVVK